VKPHARLESGREERETVEVWILADKREAPLGVLKRKRAHPSPPLVHTDRHLNNTIVPISHSFTISITPHKEPLIPFTRA